ncbi:aminoglycoside phosphotransferase family protein [Micromonospora sp. DSM 115977]|uniref:Aminoglycoside phosphotransferase family protein n=1 Tax=Micromonospora reichwaldensis TaxID=3075516 RepID=A0ABU2WU61_9ACTN|nr:aminoglycoside phosphotransferase family protein [Micromonospora sp. DSM 115977]MDT0529073.1 aminoglycoside phosphotransferase family protein [Micromonospora sp. DSM 115977]
MQADAAIDILTSVVPQAATLGATPVTKGIFSTGWRVHTTDGDYLVKINEDSRAAGDFLGARRATETALAHGVPVPRLLGSGSDGDGHAFLVQEWIDGTDAEDHFAARDGRERRRVLERLGAVLARLHDIPYTTQGPTSIHDTVAVKIRRYAARAARLEIFTPSDLDRLVAKLLELVTEVLPPMSPRLTHLDVHLPNVLVDRAGDVWLLDMDFARPGDPVEDFVKLDWWCFADDTERTAFHTAYAAHRTHPTPPRDVEAGLHLHKIITALSYVALFAEKEPQEVAEWKQRLSDERRSAARLLGEAVT